MPACAALRSMPCGDQRAQQAQVGQHRGEHGQAALVALVGRRRRVHVGAEFDQLQRALDAAARARRRTAPAPAVRHRRAATGSSTFVVVVLGVGEARQRIGRRDLLQQRVQRRREPARARRPRPSARRRRPVPARPAASTGRGQRQHDRRDAQAAPGARVRARPAHASARAAARLRVPGRATAATAATARAGPRRRRRSGPARPSATRFRSSDDSGQATTAASTATPRAHSSGQRPRIAQRIAARRQRRRRASRARPARTPAAPACRRWRPARRRSRPAGPARRRRRAPPPRRIGERGQRIGAASAQASVPQSSVIGSSTVGGNCRWKPRADEVLAHHGGILAGELALGRQRHFQHELQRAQLRRAAVRAGARNRRAWRGTRRCRPCGGSCRRRLASVRSEAAAKRRNVMLRTAYRRCGERAHRDVQAVGNGHSAGRDAPAIVAISQCRLRLAAGAGPVHPVPGPDPAS